MELTLPQFALLLVLAAETTAALIYVVVVGGINELRTNGVMSAVRAIVWATAAIVAVELALAAGVVGLFGG